MQHKQLAWDSFGRKLRVSSCLSFFLTASTAATYIFTAPNCTTTIITLEPCALKCFYFADTTERGDRGVKGGPKIG
jgi:hypothetical protein